MNKVILFLSIVGLFLFNACTSDTGFIKVTYQEANAIYGNLDDIRTTPINESPRTISNPGKIYIANDLILIGEEGQGIHVIDNTNPDSPEIISFMNIPGNREFFVKGQFLYGESYYDIVKVDISNPGNAQIIARAENVFNNEFKNAQGETLLGFSFSEVTKEVDENSDLFSEINTYENTVFLDFARDIIPRSAVPSSFAGNSNQSSGTVNRISHHMDHVYVIGRFDLNVIEDNSSFELVTQIKDIGIEMETIFPYEENLFVGSRSSIEIFDVSNPSFPVHMFRFEHATSCDPVLPENNVAYISLRTADFSPCPGNTNALIVLDINNLENPFEVKEIPMTSPYGMSIINNILYVGEGENGLTTFDASDPLNLVELSNDPTINAYDIIEHPTRSDLILIAGQDGLEQYIIDASLNLSLQSTITY